MEPHTFKDYTERTSCIELLQRGAYISKGSNLIKISHVSILVYHMLQLTSWIEMNIPVLQGSVTPRRITGDPMFL